MMLIRERKMQRQREGLYCGSVRFSDFCSSVPACFEYSLECTQRDFAFLVKSHRITSQGLLYFLYKYLCDLEGLSKVLEEQAQIFPGAAEMSTTDVRVFVITSEDGRELVQEVLTHLRSHYN